MKNDSMPTVEQKWRTNMDKVHYARNFPGRMKEWGESIGKRVQEVIDVPGASRMTVLLYADHTFMLVHESSEPAGADLLHAIEALRPHLADEMSAAYAELDELIVSDRELTRRARLENILGAIRTNIGKIPELHEEIPHLLRVLAAKSGQANDGADDEPEDGLTDAE